MLLILLAQFTTDYSPAYLLLCLAVAALYAFLLYSKKAPWGKKLNRALAALRFTIVFLICLLLLGIAIKQLSTQSEAPTAIIAIDDSQSLELVSGSEKLQKLKTNVASLQQALNEKGYQVSLRTLSNTLSNNKLDSISFDYPETNISALLKDIDAEFENQNLAFTLFVSDGIYNKGTAPDMNLYRQPIYTIGIGDTIPQKDIALKSVFHNKIAYLGNRFPILAELTNTGFVGQDVEVSISKSGKILETQTLRFEQEADLKSVEFLMTAEKKGMQHYIIRSRPLEGEFTTANNEKHVYIEVLDNKEKILICAQTAHPDIKALRKAINKNENYEVDLHIPNLFALKEDATYDLVIFHQMPDKVGKWKSIWEKVRKKNKSALYIIGANTDLTALNEANLGMRIQTSGNQSDKVTAAINPDFNKFTLKSDYKARITGYPPVEVPFGEYTLSAGIETAVFQRVGTIQTRKPLLAMGTHNENKVGFVFAENTWRWRLNEYADHEDQETYDVLFSKMIQFLASKDDKRRFRVNTTASSYSDTEPVTFQTEVYNDIYEPIFGQNISLEIIDEQGKKYNYNYLHSSAASRYQVSGLSQGAYRYKASTTLDGKNQVSQGEFTVESLQIEATKTTADFALLRRLSERNRGNFQKIENWESMQNQLLALQPQKILHSSEELSEIVRLPYLLLLIITMATVEWVIRKYKGGY
ncbi:MAG: VWA domain-containing protein [Bernardetiaceae bacterium]|nr:VWA domain-containing protein [Bernardetiaceae bacterium]